MTLLDWLLESDPSVRWQALQDLAGAPADVVAAERARIVAEGWGVRLLGLRGDDGQWAGGAYFPAHGGDSDVGPPDGADTPDGRDDSTGHEGAGDGTQPWTATTYSLLQLRDFGVDPVSEQLDDGGWNCWAEYGAVVSSAATTINVLEGLLAHERSTGGSAESIESRRRAEEYLLERRLFRRKSTGEVIDPAWLEFSFPTRWHYDVLRALECFRSAGVRATRGWPRQSGCFDPRSSPTALGCSKTRIPGRSSLSLRTVTGGPAGGTPCGL